MAEEETETESTGRSRQRSCSWSAANDCDFPSRIRCLSKSLLEIDQLGVAVGSSLFQKRASLQADAIILGPLSSQYQEDGIEQDADDSHFSQPLVSVFDGKDTLTTNDDSDEEESDEDASDDGEMRETLPSIVEDDCEQPPHYRTDQNDNCLPEDGDMSEDSDDKERPGMMTTDGVHKSSLAIPIRLLNGGSEDDEDERQDQALNRSRRSHPTTTSTPVGNNRRFSESVCDPPPHSTCITVGGTPSPPFYEEELATVLRPRKGRTSPKRDGAVKCRSEIMEKTPLSVVQTPNSLDRSLSTSTPSIDSPLFDERRDVEMPTDGGKGGTLTVNPTGSPKPPLHVKSKSHGGGRQPQSRIPTLPIAMAPHAVVTMPKNLPRSVSGSAVHQQPGDAASGKDPLKRSGSSFFGFGKFIRSGNKVKDKTKMREKEAAQRVHTFIPVSCSNSTGCNICHKALSKAASPGQTPLHCQSCDIFVHQHCKDSVQPCVAMKHPHDTAIQKSNSTGGNHKGRRSFDLTMLENSSVLNLLPYAATGGGTPTILTAADGGGCATTSHHQSVDEAPFQHPNLELQEYADLRLWQPEAEAWSLAHRDEAKGLSKKEVKRQNVIHELYLTEKHHVETLVLLKEAYRQGFDAYALVTIDELNRLVPDVIDTLLEFHTGLLRALIQRRNANTENKSAIQGSIGDLLVAEFAETQNRRIAAVDAYVRFCSSKESATKFYKEMVVKNGRFKQYVEFLSRFPAFRGHDLPQCLLLTTQRVTKYSVPIDELIKVEPNEEDRRTSLQRAAAAIRATAREIDEGLTRHFMRQKWKEMKPALDRHSTAQLLKQPFTMKDLTSFEGERVPYIFGSVLWQNATRKPVEVIMAVFDDVVVFLQQRSDHKLSYFSQDTKEAVIAMETLLWRDKASKGHPNSFFLIVNSKKVNEMYEISCDRKELPHWRRAITEAKENQKPVRRLADGDATSTLDDGNGEFDGWMTVLRQHFADGVEVDGRFAEFLSRKLDWVHGLSHLMRDSRAASVLGRRDLLQRVFDEHNAVLVRNAAELKKKVDAVRSDVETDLPQTIYQLSALVNVDGGSEPSPRPSRSPRRPSGNLPKRTDTYHGSKDLKDQTSLTRISRRHTTVPRSASDVLGADGQLLSATTSSTGLSEEECRMTADDERTAADVDRARDLGGIDFAVLKTMLIDAESSNRRLEAEMGLMKVELAALQEKCRRQATITETLEVLRRRQAEINATQDRAAREFDERQFRFELKEGRLQDKEQLMQRLEEKLKGRELELEEKWAAFMRANEERLAAGGGTTNLVGSATSPSALQQLNSDGSVMMIGGDTTTAAVNGGVTMLTVTTPEGTAASSFDSNNNGAGGVRKTSSAGMVMSRSAGDTSAMTTAKPVHLIGIVNEQQLSAERANKETVIPQQQIPMNLLPDAEQKSPKWHQQPRRQSPSSGAAHLAEAMMAGAGRKIPMQAVPQNRAVGTTGGLRRTSQTPTAANQDSAQVIPKRLAELGNGKKKRK